MKMNYTQQTSAFSFLMLCVYVVFYAFPLLLTPQYQTNINGFVVRVDNGNSQHFKNFYNTVELIDLVCNETDAEYLELILCMPQKKCCYHNNEYDEVYWKIKIITCAKFIVVIMLFLGARVLFNYKKTLTNSLIFFAIFLLGVNPMIHVLGFNSQGSLENILILNDYNLRGEIYFKKSYNESQYMGPIVNQFTFPQEICRIRLASYNNPSFIQIKGAQCLLNSNINPYIISSLSILGISILFFILGILYEFFSIYYFKLLGNKEENSQLTSQVDSLD